MPAKTRPGYRSHSPLHARYSGSQLAFAVSFLRSHERTRLVTLNIGVNDLAVCYRMTPTHCTGSAAATQLAETSKNVAMIFTTLREQAGYQGTLVLLTNYPPSYLPAQDAPYAALDAALATAAKESGARVADGFGALQRASTAFGGNPCRAGLLVPLPTGKCDYHPSAQGQQLLADAVEKAIAN
ncbi:MAG: GDSL-type esterase/lipase family protein [Jatrophihabitantaceae bacterium]